MEKEKQIEMFLLEQAKTMAKWMKWLLYLDLAEIILSILTYMPISSMPEWIYTVLTILGICVPIVCCIIFFICRKTEEHFKWFYLVIIALICGILGKLLEPTLSIAADILVIAAFVLDIIWRYHKYWGYSSVLEGINDQLSRSWKTLFKFYFIFGIGYIVLDCLLSSVYVFHVILMIASILCIIGCLIARFVLYYSSINELKAYIEKHSGEPV